MLEDWIIPCFGLLALLYASVGHGGASAYLALMAIAGLAESPSEMRTSALLLNLLVSAGSFWSFYRHGFFNQRLFATLAASSIPAAYIGANLSLDTPWFKRLLGVALVLAIIRLAGFIKAAKAKEWHWRPALLMGAGIGLFSGMIGIGGGIILSPLLLLKGWTNAKTAAGISALFIFVNSAAGLLGLFTSDKLSFHSDLPWWLLAVATGGFIGAYLGSRRLSIKQVRVALLLVLTAAAIKLLFF